MEKSYSIYPKGDGGTTTMSAQQDPKSENAESNSSLTKKTVFRKYLEKSGFKSAIIRAIVALYEDSEKPDDPLGWIFGLMGQGIPPKATIQNFQKEAKALRAKIATLQKENTELKIQVEEREEASKPELLKEYDWEGLLNYSVSDEDE